MANREYHFVAHVPSTDPYVIEYGAGGEFGTIRIWFDFDIWITIYDTPISNGNDPIIGKIVCAFPEGASAAADGIDGTSIGSGFWNAAGLMWAAPYTPQEQSLFLPPYGNDSDSKALSNTQMDAFTSNYFARFTYPDNVWPMDLTKYLPTDSAHTRYEKNLYFSDLDQYGNLKPIDLVYLYSRSYRNDHAESLTPGYPYASVVNFITALTSDALGIDWKYYPWARKIDNDWKSLNRQYKNVPISADRSAYLRIKKNGSWDDVLNDLTKPDLPDSESHIMAAGNWKRAVPYGTGA